MAKVKWHDKEFMDKLEKAVSVKMDISAQHVVKTAKQSMRDTPTSGEAVKVIRRNNNPRLTKYHNRYPRSQPDNAPAIQTGHLMRSVQWERQGAWVRRVGTNLKYGLYLELGTRKMIKRPWLMPALTNSKDFIQKQLSSLI